jgi:hypothetical protein
MKNCFVCNVKKEFTAFYKHPKMSDGYLNKCKDCTKKQSIENYNKKMLDSVFVEKERIRCRKKSKNSNYERKNRKNESIEYNKKYPEKYRAHYYTARMIKNKNYHLHHWSYNKEHYRDVIELTVKEHSKAHRFLIYDQERMMYRKLNGILLDTKENHKKYIMEMILTQED